jgi:hypothetical protein
VIRYQEARNRVNAYNRTRGKLDLNEC